MLFDTVQILVVTLCCMFASIHCAHVFQIERYQLTAYNQWMRRNRERFLKNNVLVAFIAVLLSGYLPMVLSLFISVETTRNTVAAWILLLGFVGLTTWFSMSEQRKEMPKAFAMSARMLRLLAVLLALYLVLIIVLDLFGIAVYAAYAAIPYAVWLAGRILAPMETQMNSRFYAEAQKKLRAREDLITIGITGSSGKTLTKFILSAILSKKYDVLATPESFNTEMGISRTINESLEKKHQIFIAEMGAQHVGDIKKLVKLVQPRYGLITSIGPRHLDTFGSMANIADTKFELIQGLPENGAAFFASDGGYADRLFAKCECEKYSAALGADGEHFMKALDVSFDPKGTKFVLECADGTRVRCHTKLLGHYNVQNIALAAAVAYKLGMTMNEIADAIADLPQFTKKLYLMNEKTYDDRIVIDDTMNEEPEGAAEALNVLSEFPGRRILVTWGLRQDDANDDEINYAFGTQVSGCADAMILIGEKRHLRPIVRGALKDGFPKSSIYFAEYYDDAEEILDEIASKGDTVLYEGKMC